MTDLHAAAERGDISEVRRLLDCGAPVDQLDDADETALHGAAAFGHVEVVHLLLERGAEVDQTDGDEFRTALMHAAGKGHSSTVRLLLEFGADPNAADDYAETVLVRAAAADTWRWYGRCWQPAPIPRSAESSITLALRRGGAQRP